MKIETTNLEKYAQVISTDLMGALKESAEAKGVSLDMEIALRLMTVMSEPELNKDNSLLNQIVSKEFSHDDAVAECKRKRDEALRLYEIEKLRLYLRFENNLPRDVKESFMVIDVKAMTEIIRAELAAEDQANKED